MKLEDYHIQYPSWLIVDEASLTISGPDSHVLSDEVTFVTLTDNSPDRILPVFTDENLAERFMEAAAIDPDDHLVIAAECPQKLLDFLELAKPIASHVQFDPRSATGLERFSWPIEAVMERLQNETR